MGWLGTLSGIGNVGTDLGTADTQERAFQLQKQQAESEAAYKQALAKFNLGNLNLEQQKFNAGRWSVDNSQPYVEDADGNVSLVEHDRNGGQPRLTPMPKGFQIPGGIGALTAQLRRNFPDATPDQIRDMVSYKLGLKSPWAALSPQVGADANGNPVLGTLNKGTNTFTPSTTAGGGRVAKPVPTKYQTLTDAAGNQTSVAVPAFARPNSGGAAPSAGGGTGSSVPSVGGGRIKKFAELSPDGQKQITRIAQTSKMLEDLNGILEQKDPITGVPLYKQGGQGMQKLQSIWQNFLYDHGIAGDQSWDKAIQEGTLADFTGVMGLIPGLRRGDLIQQAMSHLPERADSLLMMHNKGAEAQRLLRGNAQKVLQAEQMNKRGNMMNLTPEAAVNQLLGGAGSPTAPAAPAPTSNATPQTHTFSLSAWLRANPKGDAAAAQKAAQDAGYKVIP
jgi:hypothetical protein